jgi:hypothetical protein
MTRSLRQLFVRLAAPALLAPAMAMASPPLGEDPTRAAAEDFLHRAYPAAHLPFSATLNAIAGFNRLQSNPTGEAPVGPWSLIGPSTANFPDILTFSGEEYTTSGRITALAIDPNCSSSSCRLWVAAAGGGIWRTTNALPAAGQVGSSCRAALRRTRSVR